MIYTNGYFSKRASSQESKEKKKPVNIKTFGKEAKKSLCSEDQR